MICIPKCPVTDSPGGFLGIALPLAVAADMIADLGQQFSMDVLQRQPAVADHLAGVLQADGPQPETVLPIAVHVPFDPIPDMLSVESIRVMPHGFRVTKHQKQRLKIIRLHFPKHQSFRFQNHVL